LKAVILAAGRGTRLQPLTLTRAKHLVPVGGKPIIDHVLMAIKQGGIDDVVFIVNHDAESLQLHLGDGKKYGMKFEFAFQNQLKGTADATSFAEPFIKEDFLLTYADWLITSNAITTVLQAHKKEEPAVTMAVVPVKNPQHYGVVVLEQSLVKKIVEKPPRDAAPTNLANAGIYVLSPKVFEAIARTKLSSRGELEITDSLSLLLQEGHKIAVAELSEDEMRDVGLLWDLFEANRWVLERTPSKLEGQIEDATHVMGNVIVEEAARIRSGTYIEGPAFIGKGSDIGPNCFIRPYTSIGKKVRIGSGCEVKGSIIMDETHVGHLSYIGDSIIGENCNFGAGTTIANYRFDGKSVRMQVRERILDTGRKKLGAIFGDNVKTGVNALFMPGVKIGNNSWIGPDVLIYQDVPSNTIVLLKQNLVQESSCHEERQEKKKSPQSKS
jgi:UDP-N-acetylglucosamine diphosphorylase/glucosamine-1-phosphate N-acetyltransferase